MMIDSGKEFDMNKNILVFTRESEGYLWLGKIDLLSPKNNKKRKSIDVQT